MDHTVQNSADENWKGRKEGRNEGRRERRKKRMVDRPNTGRPMKRTWVGG